MDKLTTWNDPRFKALVQQIADGVLTKEEAAEGAGINFHTFKGWLRRSGALEQLQHTSRRAGANHWNANKDPAWQEKFERAVEEAAASDARGHVKRVAEAHGLMDQYFYLAERARKRRKELAAEAFARDVQQVKELAGVHSAPVRP